MRARQVYRATLEEGLDHEQHRMWVASLELKRPALIGTPVPGRDGGLAIFVEKPSAVTCSV